MNIYGLPEDVTRALAALSARAGKHSQYTLVVQRPVQNSWAALDNDPGPCGLPPGRSAIPAGRELYFHLEGEGTAHQRLGLLWGLAVPLGFVPWQRYPELGPVSHVFHYWGPWRIIEDHLVSIGRGEAAWPSLCAAAQCSMGTWEGGGILLREVQANLHRLGHSCGPVDGLLGPRTQQALVAAGFGGTPTNEILQELKLRTVPEKERPRTRRGRIELDVPATVHASGGVRAVRTPKGYMLTIAGEGRLVVDVGN